MHACIFCISILKHFPGFLTVIWFPNFFQILQFFNILICIPLAIHISVSTFVPDFPDFSGFFRIFLDCSRYFLCLMCLICFTYFLCFICISILKHLPGFLTNFFIWFPEFFRILQLFNILICNPLAIYIYDPIFSRFF